MGTDESDFGLPGPPSDESTRLGNGGDNDSLEFDSLDFDYDSREIKTNLAGVLGEYILLDSIGAGGMGKVFRAEHRTMNRQVALKILSDEFSNKKALLQQFFSEIRAVAKFMHPNIVTAFDAGSSGGIHYLVMELVEGNPLSATVKREGPMTMAGAVSVLEQAGRALSYAHSLGIVHRDIKPGNMMLTHDGVLKILDFGLARISNQQILTGKTKRYFMGTPEYMSPEQIENPDSVDGRSDLYSLGATLYFLLTGKAMFTGEMMRVAKSQRDEAPKPLYELRSDVDLRVDTVFQRLVAKMPSDRYESADALLAHMTALELSAEPGSDTTLNRTNSRLKDESTPNSGLGQSTLAKKPQVVGIDLGMLTSCSAVYVPGEGPQVVPQGDPANPLYLRNMLWSSDTEVSIGAGASEKRQVDPDKIFHSIQRWIGMSQVQRPFGGEIVPPEVLLAALIRQVMLNSAEAADESTSAIVTVPACYGQTHRRAIRNACVIAGVDLVQLLDKPLAAALTWIELNGRMSEKSQAKRAADDRLLVLQLTGAGLDASIIHAHGSEVKQLGHCGNWKLGLQRWQHMLIQYFSERLKEMTDKDIRTDVGAATRLQRTVEIAMKQLTSSSKVEVRFDWLGSSIKQVITQAGLVKIAPDLPLCIQQSIAGACELANTDPSEIDQVLLAGSMTRMKSVQKIITDVIPHDVGVSWMEQADLARGAAIMARQVSSLSQNELLPSAVSCASLDVALLADSPDSVQKRPKVLIEGGKTIPTSHTRTLRPRSTGKGALLPTIQLIESSSQGSGRNWLKLGRIKPSDAFPDLTADGSLQLRLEIDTSGILCSTLFDPTSNESVMLPGSSDPELTTEELGRWRNWLEEVMLLLG